MAGLAEPGEAEVQRPPHHEVVISRARDLQVSAQAMKEIEAVNVDQALAEQGEAEVQAPLTFVDQADRLSQDARTALAHRARATQKWKSRSKRQSFIFLSRFFCMIVWLQ